MTDEDRAIWTELHAADARDETYALRRHIAAIERHNALLRTALAGAGVAITGLIVAVLVLGMR